LSIKGKIDDEEKASVGAKVVRMGKPKRSPKGGKRNQGGRGVWKHNINRGNANNLEPRSTMEKRGPEELTER